MHTLEQLHSGALAGIRRLDLVCGLTTLPQEVFELADTLEVLNLSGNQLHSLPPDLARLHRLKVIFCSDNCFTELPAVLGECPLLEVVGFKANRITQVPGAALPPKLRWLILTDNAIQSLPTELGARPALQKLMLAGNQLQSLPPSLASAQNLELIRLSANQLEQVPPWLLELPRLAWLALAGNPMGWAQPQHSGIAQVPWQALQLHGLLGEGASGHIYHVQHTAPAVGLEALPAQNLALKLFKGALTSDGLPEHELAASLVAGQHPALCTPSGELVGHPQGARGLLLPLIPAHYINLAAPPSLDSCTRDVYAPGLQMGAALALRVAAHIASAVAHLHQQGVVHGDVYAHNVLWNPTTGCAMLSDFGAATVLSTSLSPDSVAINQSLKALEVRALGCLLQELHDHSASDTHASLQLAELVRLAKVAQACLNPCAAQRPSGQEVARQLAEWAVSNP